MHVLVQVFLTPCLVGTGGPIQSSLRDGWKERDSWQEGVRGRGGMQERAGAPEDRLPFCEGTERTGKDFSTHPCCTHGVCVRGATVTSHTDNVKHRWVSPTDSAEEHRHLSLQD